MKNCTRCGTKHISKSNCNERTGYPHKSTFSNNQKKWLKRHGERRKDKGDGGGSIILKVVCEELFVTKLCVKELCVKDCL